LATYIEQQGVERGFRFIKSGEFHLDNIYLKLPSRIDALMMMMTLSLMVYNTTEYQMRESMAEQEVTLPNQKGKETAQPTLRWVFQMMQGVHTLKLAGVPDYVVGNN
jgi:transposase